MKTFYLIVLGLVVALFLGRNLPLNLDSYDQAKQAYVSYQMIESGAWWFQRTPDGDVATKPPLMGWVSAGVALVTGKQWWLAWLLPSLLSGCLLLWLLDRGAQEIFSASPATDPWLLRTVMVAALGLNMLAPHLATLVRTDLPLSFLLFVPGYLIWRKQVGRADWTHSERWIFAGAGLASMLTKGPLIGLFVLPGMILTWGLLRRRRERFFGWCGWWPWLLPLAVFGLWVAAGIRWEPGFYEEVVLKEFAGRVTGEHQSQPVYFYVAQLLLRMAPWSLLLIGLALSRRGRELARERPELLWLICWTLGALVVMSLVPSKRTDRIFPIVPPACLWLVTLLAHWKSERIGGFARRKFLLGVVAIAAAFATIYTAGNVVIAYREDRGGVGRFGRAASKVAEERGWNLWVARARDEGLAMYAGQPGFLKQSDAIQRWQQGKASAVILETKAFSKAAPEMPGAQILATSPVSYGSGRSYVFIGPSPDRALRPDR